MNTLEKIDYYVNEIMTMRSECFLLCHKNAKLEASSGESFASLVATKKSEMLEGEDAVFKQAEEQKWTTLKLFMCLVDYYRMLLLRLEEENKTLQHIKLSKGEAS